SSTRSRRRSRRSESASASRGNGCGRSSSNRSAVSRDSARCRWSPRADWFARAATWSLDSAQANSSQDQQPGCTATWLQPQGLFRAQVELEIRRRDAQLAQCARLELTHALARDAEPGADLFERLRGLAVETKAEREHAAHARVEVRERVCELVR